VAPDPQKTAGQSGTPLNWQFLFTLTGTVGPALEIGPLPHGQRRVIPIEGGEFAGPRLRGQALPVGADWIFIRPDGVAEIDVRATLRTDDGALILMRYGGYRHGPPDVMARLARGEPADPASYYFRITPVFETGSPRYAWLNRIVSAGTGRRMPHGPVYDIYEILRLT
jgi:Protein of unknown function (DUF3237)